MYNKRFVTYENGDVVCQNCDGRPAVPVCASCNVPIQGGKFYTDPNGVVTCENCEQRGQRCPRCAQLFRFNEPRRVMSNGTPYHEHCFICSVCNTKIEARDFFQNELMQPMCLPCHTLSKLPKCTFCMKPLTGQYLLIDSKPLHHECFRCTNCNSLINSEIGYFKNKLNNAPICGDCNLKLNGAKCYKCSMVIEKEGVTYADHDYHQHCFKCDRCGVELVKMKKTLTDKNGQGLYCEPCFTQNFAPRCAKCANPITPHLPGVVFENQNYHRECFACSRCKKTLAGRKFSKVGNITVCEQCS